MKLFKLIRRLILLLIVFTILLCFSYAYFLSPDDYTFKNHDYINSLLDSSLNGLKIAYISDINITDNNSIERLEKIIKELNEKPFDIILFGGDLYDQDVIETKKISSLLKNIDCEYGKFAILGEKDQNSKIEVTQVLNNGGFEVLNNEVRTLYYKNANLTLVACDEKTNIKKLKIPKNNLSICLTHQPDNFIKNKEYIDLQLSGHSYGGSIYIPYLGALNTFEGAKTYNHGSYVENKSTLIISNGVSGPSSFPYKLFARNQINFITLKTSG